MKIEVERRRELTPCLRVKRFFATISLSTIVALPTGVLSLHFFHFYFAERTKSPYEGMILTKHYVLGQELHWQELTVWFGLLPMCLFFILALFVTDQILESNWPKSDGEESHM